MSNGAQRSFRTRAKGLFFSVMVILIFAITTYAALAVPQTFGGCFISTGKGLLPDIDCDKVPDVIDNCPVVPNPDQFDQTQNGLGDACDLIIERVEADPPVMLQGRSFTTNLLLTNYREYDLRNLRVQVEVPVLGISEHATIGVLPTLATTELELTMRAPECAMPGEYDLVLVVEYPYTAGKKEVFSQPIRIAVQESGQCPVQPTTLDKTIVDIIDIQDVDPVEGAVYPFTVTNNEPISKAYVLDIDGTADWGYSQIEPGTLMVVPPGESRHGLLHVWANEGVTGERGFLLTVQAKDDIKQVPLIADMPEPPSKYTPLNILSWLLAALIIAGIVIVAVLLVKNFSEKE
jgi:hypothetical protein